jgi:class 3 adenylate cyclase/tetratricopeptide (TPR) repeat protein
MRWRARDTPRVASNGRTCAGCATANPAGARFCMSCGAELARVCASCGAELPGEARFCMQCGTAADGAEAPAAAPPARAPEASDDAERRRVTVLFADLSGYTAVSERLDPEAVREVADRALRRLASEVDRYGGTVDKYIGDNVMAIFGAPVAHEDDPVRAIRAGFGMQEAMAELNAELDALHGASFQLRVGINTGEVLAGEVAGTYTVMGDTVNVAARIQSAGSPGSVTVGEQTWRAARDSVAFRELEPLSLKGKSEPVPAYEALGRLTERVPRSSGAPLIGRDEELALLESLQRRSVSEDRPHLVTVVGEAGVGKSRLLEELESRLCRGDPAPVVRQGRCLAYGSGTVYWAMGEILRGALGIADTDSADAAWAKLDERVTALAAPDAVPLIARLLSMEVPAADDEELDPQRLREAFLSAVRAVVEGMARERPLVLAFEDIHWADQGLLDLIEHLAQWVRGPVLIVALARDELLERRGAWGSGRRATTLFLDPLTRDQTRELVTTLLPDADADAVAERAGGNPFFAEEMVRRLSDEHVVSVEEMPDSVHALLAARLDALEPFERRVVQRAAVIGRTFWPEALDALERAEGDDLQAALGSLADKDLIVPAAGGSLAGASELAFKHVLIRDVAYSLLPRATRARTHHEVGRFVQERAGDRTDEVAPLLGEHYGRAAALGAEARLDEETLEPMRADARRFVEAAGDAAARLFSNEEAFEHYGAALALIEAPAERARVADKRGDIALRLGRIDAALEAWRECLEHHRAQEDLPAIGATLRKIGAALTQQGERRAAIEHYQQGMNLLKDGPPSRELVRLYEDAAWLYVQSGDNMLAIYASEKALRLAQQLGETTAVSRAHGIFGRVFSRIGDAGRARENLEKAVDLAREGGDELEEILALLALGNHLEVAEADYAAAQRAYADALEVAERIGDVPSQVELHSALAQLAVYRADWDAVQNLSDASARLAEESGLVLKMCLPYALRGFQRWRAGDWDAAEADYGRSAELAEDVGWSEVAFAATYGLSIARRDRGDHDGALAALDRAREISERAGLTVQAIQALANRAVVLALAGRQGEARGAAEEATALTERVQSPVGEVAALEADGATSEGDRAAELLGRARDGWNALGRPLDAARCELLAAVLSDDADGYAAAAEAFDRLGVGHLAGRAREAAVG